MAFCPLQTFAETAQPQASNVLITRSVPSKVYLGAGGDQIPITLEGNNLHLIRGIRVYRNRQPVREILGRLGARRSEIRNAYFIAAPTTPVDGVYEVFVITKNRATLRVPLVLRVVPSGDERARALTLEEMLANAPERDIPQVLRMDAKLVPVVEQTLPAPFTVAADGNPKEVELRGQNLDKVTEIRIRPAHKRTYIRKSGQVPFELTPGGNLKLELFVSRSTPPGSKYCLDLLMGRYIAQTLTVEVSTTPQSDVAEN